MVNNTIQDSAKKWFEGVEKKLKTPYMGKEDI